MTTFCANLSIKPDLYSRNRRTDASATTPAPVAAYIGVGSDNRCNLNIEHIVTLVQHKEYRHRATVNFAHVFCFISSLTVLNENNVVSILSLDRLRVLANGRSKGRVLKFADHAASHHPTQISSRTCLVLRKRARNLCKCDSFFKLSLSLQNFRLLDQKRGNLERQLSVSFFSQ